MVQLPRFCAAYRLLLGPLTDFRANEPVLGVCCIDQSGWGEGELGLQFLLYCLSTFESVCWFSCPGFRALQGTVLVLRSYSPSIPFLLTPAVHSWPTDSCFWINMAWLWLLRAPLGSNVPVLVQLACFFLTFFSHVLLRDRKCFNLPVSVGFKRQEAHEQQGVFWAMNERKWVLTVKLTGL